MPVMETGAWRAARGKLARRAKDTLAWMRMAWKDTKTEVRIGRAPARSPARRRGRSPPPGGHRDVDQMQARGRQPVHVRGSSGAPGGSARARARRWKIRCIPYCVRSAMSRISTNCSAIGWAATVFWMAGLTAQRKNTAAGARLSSALAWTRRWLAAEVPRGPSATRAGRSAARRSRREEQLERHEDGGEQEAGRAGTSRGPRGSTARTGVATATSEPPMSVASSASPAAGEAQRLAALQEDAEQRRGRRPRPA